ncbi:hypothetical protein WAI453_003316 [Rhynchosporium graminicola]
MPSISLSPSPSTPHTISSPASLESRLPFQSALQTTISGSRPGSGSTLAGYQFNPIPRVIHALAHRTPPSIPDSNEGLALSLHAPIHQFAFATIPTRRHIYIDTVLMIERIARFDSWKALCGNPRTYTDAIL